MTLIDSTGKIVTQSPAPTQAKGAVPSQVSDVGIQTSHAAVSKVTHVIAAVLASVAAFALTPAGQALIAQYPHLAVISGLVATLASLYKAPQADA